MSDPRLISPLLDGFMMGAPISSHDGVRCCPAMKADSGEKYIVKVVSVPAAQGKLEALLLAGAFSGKEDAMGYFEDLAKDITDEAALLQHLSKLEGFSSYEGWQVVPMEDGETGFDVYLVSAYHQTLARFLRRNPMTHLGAVNLGLDLCAALSVCRRNGYLYVDIKPENILITPQREYQIADLGFVKMSSLSYASLPDKYLSAYTAPEIQDAYSSLNDTLDTYAAGLVLYQVYNNGQLPFAGRAPDAVLPPPQYADYEMAQIILKACDPDPAKRWADPMQMGQALVSYLQRNNINDDPIVPPTIETEPEPVEDISEESFREDDDPSTQQVIDEVNEVLAAVGAAGEDEAQDGSSVENEPAGETPAEETPSVNEGSSEEIPEEDPVSVEDAPEEAVPAEIPATSGQPEESDDLETILAQADELIAHETPTPAVAPDPIDVPVPAPIAVAVDTGDEALPDTSEETAAETEEGSTLAPEEAVPDEPAPRKAGKKSHKGLIVTLVLLLLIAALGYGTKYFYDNYYLQPILNVTVTGEEDRMTVSLNTQIQDEKLTVICSDSYGNTIRQKVTDRQAVFESLRPDTRYSITVEISGFHKLIGTTTGSYTTPGQTSINSISIVTGKEDSEVILSFTVQGDDSDEWTLTYKAEGEEARSAVFKGHMVTISGLTVGKEYTFSLESVSPLYLVGESSTKFLVTGIHSAQNLAIQGFFNNALSVTWDAPENIVGTVESWTVRCYNDADYDKTVTVTETSALFEDADPSLGYTVEVTAAGMSVGTRTFVSAQSVTIHKVNTGISASGALDVTWEYEGQEPEGGWLLLYTMDDDTTQHVVQAATNSASLSPVVPGTTYHLSIRPSGGNTVFGGTAEYTAAEAGSFSGYLIQAENVILKMCRTPEKDTWLMEDVPEEDFVTTFAPGEKASFAVTLNHEYNTSSDIIVTLFVIRDANGHIVSTATQSRTWTSMWHRGFGRINIPSLPETPGNYTLELYFNNMRVSVQNFSVATA